MNLYPKCILESTWDKSFPIGYQIIRVNAKKLWNEFLHVVFGSIFSYAMFLLLFGLSFLCGIYFNIAVVMSFLFSFGITCGINGYQVYTESEINPTGILQNYIDAVFWLLGNATIFFMFLV